MLGKQYAVKRFALVLLGLVFLMGAGCCRMADRWCGHNTPPTPTYSPPPYGYAPAGGCQPCAPVCCPQPAASSPGGQWQRGPYGCP